MRREVKTGLAALAVAVLAPASGATAASIAPDVTTDGIANDNNCTLREAVQAANTNAAVDDCAAGEADALDTISLAAQTYNITVSGPSSEDANVDGDLDVNDLGGPVRIHGLGANASTIDSDVTNRAIEIPGGTGAKTTVSDVALQGSAGAILQGGTIRSESKLLLERVIIEDGHAQFGGGFMCFQTSCKTTIRDSVIRENQAVSGSGSCGTCPANGGGINLSLGSLKIVDTDIRSNEAVANISPARGGGIHVGFGKLTLRNSAVINNIAYSSTDSSAATSTRRGGGLYAFDRTSIVNSTFGFNTADSTGNPSQGGAIMAGPDGTVTVHHSTFASNGASDGSAVATEESADPEQAPGRAAVRGSILYAPGQTVCAELGGTVVSKGFNVIDPGPPAGCLTGPASDKDVLADPEMLPIPQDNGGPTDTFALDGSSPAVDLVPTRKCRPAKRSDQRGAERPARRRCDAGSYEHTRCLGEEVGVGWIFGTPRKDKLFGLSGDDDFAPSAGNDKVKAGPGEDVACGGSGSDTLRGDEGNDRLDGGRGTDTCDGGPGADEAKACEHTSST